jgi:hypothetical protein
LVLGGWSLAAPIALGQIIRCKNICRPQKPIWLVAICWWVPGETSIRQQIPVSLSDHRFIMIVINKYKMKKLDDYKFYICMVLNRPPEDVFEDEFNMKDKLMPLPYQMIVQYSLDMWRSTNEERSK